MRFYKLIPAIIALVVILCAPVSSMPICKSPPHGGLVCYCCSGKGKNCTMISCSKSKADAAFDDTACSPEIILETFYQLIFLQPLICKSESFHPPGMVYLNVPVKPPNNV